MLKTLQREQLIFHSDFLIPKKHRLIDELLARRSDLQSSLGIPLGDEPVHIYLFDDPEHFNSWVRSHHPDFQGRRAVFEKTDTDLRVYAVWGDHVGEDLRHEVTHGYLNGAVPNLPLWLDEGLAEYHEVPRGEKGLNQPHVHLLANDFREGRWTPNLKRLEQVNEPAAMNQVHYAEAWLWTHYMMNHSEATRRHISSMMHELRANGLCQSLSEKMGDELADTEFAVAMHLKKISDADFANSISQTTLMEKPSGQVSSLMK